MSATRAVDRQIRELFHQLGLDVEGDDTDLFATGVLNSLSFVELLTALEEAFGVRFQLADLEPEHFCSVRAIASFVTTAAHAGAHQESRSA
jgi:acyl carrier protein